MPTNDISGTIDLSVNNSTYVIDNLGFLGYSFDLNLNSMDANGTIYIYCQNTDPAIDTYTRPEKLKYVVTSGEFLGSYSSQPVDSAFLTVSTFCVIKWAGTGTGTLHIIGQQKVFF